MTLINTLILIVISVALLYTWMTGKDRTKVSPAVDAEKGDPILDDQSNRRVPPDAQLRKIYETAWLLRQKLNADVVPAIIHHAGLFQRRSEHFRPEKPCVISQHQAPHACVTMAPIKGSARLKNPVRKVVFAIQSSDQGWVSDHNSGSYSWFTAGRVTADGERAVESGIDPKPVNGHREAFLDSERQIFRNDVAGREFKTHIVEWSVDSEDEDERQWVAALRNGDKVIVRAWAQYAGWQNRVKSVTVATYTAVII